MPVSMPFVRLTAALVAFGATACAAENARQAPAVASAADSAAAAAPADSALAGTRDSAAGDVAAAPGDTARRGAAGVLAAGRNRHDAESFAAAIRKGESKLAAWPKGPAPLAGALLPGAGSWRTTATRIRRRWA
jgi:Tfp pilus assembly protein FimV